MSTLSYHVFQSARLIIPLTRQRLSEGESFDDIRCWLREVPAVLEDVYVYIFNNVIEARNPEQSFLKFQWVYLAERPLTVSEMRYALTAKNAQITRSPKAWEKVYGFVESDERMKRKIKAISGGLAEVVLSKASKETIQVVHQWVNDFLREKGLAVLSDKIGASSPSMRRENILLQCQATLYRSCLVYLAILKIRGDISSDPQETKKELIRNHPLLAYATTNLFIHAEKAADARLLMLSNEQDILQQVISQLVQIYEVLDPTACPPKGTPIIHMAAAANLVDMIKYVSVGGEDVTKKDKDGNTAFDLAARHGHITGGGILLEKGADCEAENMNGRAPLIEAASCGHLKFVEWLLYEGAKLETTMGRSQSALQAASLGGYQTVVEIMLGGGAEVNAKGGKYGNALQAAAIIDGGNNEMVQILLGAGADVNAHGGRYGSSLMAAIHTGHNDTVEVLLHSGADPLLASGLDQTSLHIAALKDMLDLLYRLPVLISSINTRNKLLQTPLHLAISLGHIDFANKLLHFGANPSLPDGYGRTSSTG